MTLGDIEVHLLTDGTLRLDGGAMFGVVPKPLWERKAPADDRNRILLAMNILLIRAAGKWLLVETGAGDKWDAKLRSIYAIENSPSLIDKLSANGITPVKIDVVINTHLHFDHCGWNTRMVNGKVVPTFPNARYVVQRLEFDHAMKPTERDRASYEHANFVPIDEAGQWNFVDGDTEIVPGVELVVAPGHTRHMQCVKVSSGGKTIFFTADLVPTSAHLPYPWVMGYDLYPLTTLENKKKWLPRAVREGWTVVFPHDPKTPAVRLHERETKLEFEPVAID
ncbi:MAG TPA: MBL fold metallo-hydrolase [Candidatus Acidoferrales bacterium]|nr:MBL fold metallo-hydrolase [Candidatus Acidoferrales bacterium]